MTMPVKICGITRAQDAALAARLGAAWVGFVFWRQSPRFVEPQTAMAILAALPPHVAGVGVFVDQPVDEINAIADQVGLAAVQLHGGESGAACGGLSAAGDQGHTTVGREHGGRPGRGLGQGDRPSGCL